MAKVKIQGHASGTGVLTVTAPNTNDDSTITLPDGDVTLGAATPSIDDNGNATAITIDSSENVGIGVTPESWHSSYTALQVGAGGAIADWDGTDNGLYLGANWYYDDADRYIETNEATNYIQEAGIHRFKVASSGSADAAISWTTAMVIDNNGIVTIDQDTDNEALIIDSESASDWATKINAKYGLLVQQDISGGQACNFQRNIDEAGSSPLVVILDDHTSNTQPALQIQQDGAGYGIQIDQNGNSNGLYIDSESTGYNTIRTFGKYGISCDQDLSGGYAGNFVRNLAEAGSNPLVTITDDHTSNTQPALKIQQDGAGYGLLIDQNGDEYGIRIDTSYGQAGYFYSNSTDTSTSNLVQIINDNTLATGTTALYVKQDSTGLCASLDGAVTINDTGADVNFRVESSANANALVVDGLHGAGIGVGAISSGEPLVVGSSSTTAYNTTLTHATGDDCALAIRNESDTNGNFCGINFLDAGGFGNAGIFCVNEDHDSGGGGYLAILTREDSTTPDTMTQRLRVDGDGLKFNADTAAANALDDYEEGSWTPVVYFGTTDNTHHVYYANYTKIGRAVMVTCNVQVLTTSSGSGNVSMEGLPFVSSVGAKGQTWSGNDGMNMDSNAMNFGTTGVISFVKKPTSTGEYLSMFTNSDVHATAAGKYIAFTAWYMTAS